MVSTEFEDLFWESAPLGLVGADASVHSVNVNGANVSLSATSEADINAEAKAYQDGGGNATGIGASVAINIADNDMKR